jgi:hypothetical protein
MVFDEHEDLFLKMVEQINVKVNLDTLIEEIYVSPTASIWFRNTVENF